MANNARKGIKMSEKEVRKLDLRGEICPYPMLKTNEELDSDKDINILEDPNIRIKLSEHSGWPTIPQLFVKGELIGGADITTELHQNGQLLDILDKANE